MCWAACALMLSGVDRNPCQVYGPRMNHGNTPSPDTLTDHTLDQDSSDLVNVATLVKSPYWEDKPPPVTFKGRRYRSIRTAEQVTTIVVHATKTQIDPGKNLVKKHKGDMLLARMNRLYGVNANRRGVPYHGVWSPKDRTQIALWHWRYRTSASDAANRYSVAWACITNSDPETDPNLDIGQMCTGFRLFVECLFDSGGCLPRHVEFHSQHARKPTDPDKRIAQAIDSECRGLGLRIRPNRTTGHGKPVREDWRWTGA